jgi:hypothetical protein
LNAGLVPYGGRTSSMGKTCLENDQTSPGIPYLEKIL